MNIDGSASVGLPISLFWYMPEVRISSVELRPQESSTSTTNERLVKSVQRFTRYVCVCDSMRYKNTTYR